MHVVQQLEDLGQPLLDPVYLALVLDRDEHPLPLRPCGLM